MDDCYIEIPHPGIIAIYENGKLREKLPFTEYPMAFSEIKVTVDGKECIQKTPVEIVHEVYLDANGEPVTKEYAFTIILSGQDKDGKSLFQAHGRNDENR